MFCLLRLPTAWPTSTVATFPPNAPNDIIGGYLRGLDIRDDHGVWICLLTAHKIDLKVRTITDMDKARFEKDSDGFLWRVPVDSASWCEISAHIKCSGI
jgi:hypothetical protein